MSRYVKCMLTLENRHEFDFLLMTVDRAKSGYLSDEYVEAAREISSALKYHRDSTGYKKMLEE